MDYVYFKAQSPGCEACGRESDTSVRELLNFEAYKILENMGLGLTIGSTHEIPRFFELANTARIRMLEDPLKFARQRKDGSFDWNEYGQVVNFLLEFAPAIYNIKGHVLIERSS